MSAPFVIGVGHSLFGRHLARSHADLAAEVLRESLADAGLEQAPIEAVWFGSCAMQAFGQPNIRGQVALAPAVAQGLLPAGLPVANVEAGCATGALALVSAAEAIRAGSCDLALVVGVDKTLVPDDPMSTLHIMNGGMDLLQVEARDAFYAAACAEVGQEWAPRPDRLLFLDVHAAEARHHMARWGSGPAHYAAIAARAQAAGLANPRAQVRRGMSPEQILADKPILAPFTRSMCCPVGDGAAAALLCSETWLSAAPAALQRRALPLLAWSSSGGQLRLPGAPSVTARAAARLWSRSGRRPDEVDLVELHDATAFCTIAASEALGLCAPGQGAAWCLGPEVGPEARVCINPSGGLLSRGHPLAATGLAMLAELALQLRGEGGARHAGARRLGLLQNAGGLCGFDEAMSVVALVGARAAGQGPG